jgi:hypothetical protein
VYSTRLHRILYTTSGLDQVPTPGKFHAYFYKHAYRIRLEKLLYIELSRTRSPNGYFKPLLDPGTRSNSDIAARRFQKRNGYKFIMVIIRKAILQRKEVPVRPSGVGC